MTRSILLSIMFIAGALGVIVFSAAQFTDFEFSESQPIQAGTVDLVFEDTSTSEALCDFPGDGLEGAPLAAQSRARCEFTLTQGGSLELTDLYAQLTITPIACRAEGGLEGPGQPEYSEHCDATADLTAAQFTVTQASLTPAIAPGFSTSSELNTFPTTCQLIITDMVPGTTYAAVFEIELQQHRTTNAMQGDALRFKFDFELVEDGGTGDCVNDDA